MLPYDKTVSDQKQNQCPAVHLKQPRPRFRPIGFDPLSVLSRALCKKLLDYNSRDVTILVFRANLIILALCIAFFLVFILLKREQRGSPASGREAVLQNYLITPKIQSYDQA